MSAPASSQTKEIETSKPHPLATLFLGNRHLLVLFVLVSLVAGLAALKGLPRLEDPVITNRNPLIITPYPGASADRVESQVTEPIERELEEIPEIKHIDSTSRAGISVIALELADHVTPQTNGRIFSEIRDRLDDARATFPPGVRPPDFDDKRNAVAYTLIAAIRWQDGAEDRSGILARQAEELADRLRGVPGTDLVRLNGAPEEAFVVEVDEAELVALGLDPSRVAEALRAADAKLPSGRLRSPEVNILLEVEGELDSLARLRSVPLSVDDASGRTVRLGDVATVSRSVQEPLSEIGLADGDRAVFVSARVQEDRRVDLWAEQANAAVAEFRDTLGGGLEVEIVFDQSRYTSERLGELTNNLLLGAIVVLAVIFFTMGWRSSLIVGLALPMTASITLFVVALQGGKLHQMSIFGMIIALGLLIDNAIVMSDEVAKHLRRGKSRLAAFSAALHHLFLPLLASTLTTILAFMPILLLPGAAGDFVGSIAGSVIVALSASFVVAVTVIGALSGLFAARNSPDVRAGATGADRPDRFAWLRSGVRSERLTQATRRVLGFGIRHPWLGAGTALVIPVIGFTLAGTLGSQFFPRTDRNMFEVEVTLPTETSIERSRAVAESIEAVLRENPAVTRVDWLIGGSFPSVYYNLIMNQDGSRHYAHGIVTATNFEAVSEMIAPLQAEIDAQFPEAQVLLTKFAQGPPANADVEFRLLGPSVATLQDLGEELRVVLAEHPGILHTRTSLPRGEPKLWFTAGEEEARLAGLDLAGIAGQLQAAFDGVAGGSVLEGIEELPVRIRFGENRYDDIASLRQTSLLSPAPSAGEASEWIPLSALGEVELRPDQGAITRRDGERVNTILGFARPDALAIGIAEDVRAALEARGFSLPAGYHLELGGESENQAEAVGNLMLYLPVIAVLTVAVLILSFRSVRIAIILLLVAPLSAGFGLLATWAMQFPLSFNTIIGSLGLMGLAFNSSIVVLAAIRSNAAAKAGDPDAITEAVMGSGRHLVSTTLTTIGSFLPLLLFIGGQFWPPLAIVLAGGAGGSTLLAMTFTPSLYRILACPDQKVCLFHRLRLRAPRDRSHPMASGGQAPATGSA